MLRMCWSGGHSSSSHWDQFEVPAGSNLGWLEQHNSVAQTSRALGDPLGLPPHSRRGGLLCPSQHPVEVWDTARHLKQQYTYLGISQPSLLIHLPIGISVHEPNPTLGFPQWFLHMLRDASTELVVAGKQGPGDNAGSYTSVKACMHTFKKHKN